MIRCGVGRLRPKNVRDNRRGTQIRCTRPRRHRVGHRWRRNHLPLAVAVTRRHLMKGTTYKQLRSEFSVRRSSRSNLTTEPFFDLGALVRITLTLFHRLHRTFLHTCRNYVDMQNAVGSAISFFSKLL